ncbi:NAD(P)/FAD-dependent oxidoreductase [Desulforhopalus sp. 52FAK]
MKPHLLLIGGGHAHMITLQNIDNFTEKGYQVTVIQPSPYHYYSGMGPGMLGNTYHPDDIRFATQKLVESKGGTFLQDTVYRIDPEQQIVYLQNSRQELYYDMLSCNAGSYVPKDVVQGTSSSIFTSKPIEELQRAKETILELTHNSGVSIAVLGSGPAAIEIAGNIHQLCKQESLYHPQIQLFGGRKFMSGRPSRVQKLTRKILQNKGIEIIESGYVKSVVDGQITLENNTNHRADIIFPALGVRPSKIFSRSGLAVGPDGGLNVNEFLQSTSHANIFGGGDCIYFEKQPLDKVGVYAVRQNHVLYNNLMAALAQQPLQKFSPGGDYLLIYNLGDKQGVLSKWSFTFSGRLAFEVKNYIDRKFIQTFQE